MLGLTSWHAWERDMRNEEEEEATELLRGPVFHIIRLPEPLDRLASANRVNAISIAIAVTL